MAKKLLVFLAATMTLAACENNDVPQVDAYYPLVRLDDRSAEEWFTVLPQCEKCVAEAVCPDDAPLRGLKSIKVYADAKYINLLVEPNLSDVIKDRSDVHFCVYINTDNSNNTGGEDKDGEFTDANADIMLDGRLWYDSEFFPYQPSVYMCSRDQNWQLSDIRWPSHGVAEANLVNYMSRPYHEIQITRDMIPATWSSEGFDIGFDIRLYDEPVGILPVVSPITDNPNGYTHKMHVIINND